MSGLGARPQVGAVNGRRTPLSRRFESAPQTITPGGTLTLAHGLNGMPQLVQVRLVCTTADDGYVPGDEVVIGTVGDLNLNEGNPGKGAGCQISPDTTNLNIIYGNYASGGTFVIMNATTGQETQASNSNWNAVFIAWR